MTALSPTSTRPSNSIRTMPKAYNNRGIAYCSKGDNDHAIADFDKAIQLKPDYAMAYNNRGTAYTIKATMTAPSPISIKPFNSSRTMLMPTTIAATLTTKRRLRPRHRRLTIGHPTQAGLCRGLQQSRESLIADKGDYDRAIADFDQAIQLKPDYADAYYNRGIAYHDKGDYDRAIADL